MKHLFRHPEQSRSGYAALLAFAVVYGLTITMMIAPDRVMAALDGPWSLASNTKVTEPARKE